MKKYFKSLFAAAALVFAASSCSQEEVIGNETSGNEVEVAFNLEMEGQTASRAIGDGLTVDEVIMGVFDESGTEIKNLKTTAPVNNLGAVVKVRLVKGQTYQFVFWAQKKDAGHYNTDDMAAIKLNANNDSYLVLNNDETRDAFYAHEGATKVTGSFTKNITMKRPFAQLNLATTEDDLKWAENAGVVIDKTTVTVEGNVYSQLNTLTGYCSKEIKATFELNAIPDKTKEKLTIKDTEKQFDNDDYYFLSTSYLLTSAKEQLSKEIVFTLMDGEKEINTLTVANAPLQRNWRTNIIGEILTGEGTFNIVIDPIFDADRNYPMDGSELDIWDGTYAAPTQNAAGEYVIDAASKLAYIWSNPDNMNWSNKTFTLTKDLSFKNVEYDSRAEENKKGDTTPAVIKPLFGSVYNSKKTGASNITFKGNDHVIRDFIIDGEDILNSFFGALTRSTVENLTIINADVTGKTDTEANAAIVVAATFGVKLHNVTVKDSKLKGVQKVGGLIGQIAKDGNSEILNCVVDGLTVTSINMVNESGSTGGLIGAANYNVKIENSYVKNSTLDVIQSVAEAKRANSQFIGVILNSKTEITNCGVDNVTLNNSIAWTAYNEPFVGGNRGNSTLIVNGKTSCATIDEVANALNAGKEVILGASIKAEKALHINSDKEITLDLNGHTISAGETYTASPKGLIRVDGGATVIVKNGTVDASGYKGDISAITVPKGKLIIESGTFKVGDDVTSRNDLIIANPDCEVIINGGEFQYTGNYNGYLYTLNRPNVDAPATFIVNGGRFYQFIPGTTNPDGHSLEHVLGDGKKVYKNDDTTPTEDKTPGTGAWYTVR